MEAPNPTEALNLAIKIAGGQSALARMLNVTQAAVWKWVNKAKQMSPRYVLRAEAATGVSRHHLRPDIYPVDLPEASSRWSGVDRCAGVRANGLDRRSTRVSFNNLTGTKGAAA